MGILKSVLILLVGAALATFIWSNYESTVVIHFTSFFRTVEIPLSAALVGAILAGFVLAVAMSLPNQFRLRSKIRELNRKIDRMQKEIGELRKLPLDDALPEASDAPLKDTDSTSLSGT